MAHLRAVFIDSVADDGRIILDIRSKKLATAVVEMSKIGYVRALEKAANNSADRIMLAKTGFV